MNFERTDRLNPLLKEVISEVIRREVFNPHVHRLFTITQVEITKDLHYAKVYVSVLASEEEKDQTIQALTKSSGFISKQASRKVILRYFPKLIFKLDRSGEKQFVIDTLINKVQEERKKREFDHLS